MGGCRGRDVLVVNVYIFTCTANIHQVCLREGKGGGGGGVHKAA